MKIVKQWIQQNNFFEQRDHAKILSLFIIIFSILSQSHHIKFIIYIHFLNLFSTLIFFSLHYKNIEKDEKNPCVFDESITL